MTTAPGADLDTDLMVRVGQGDATSFGTLFNRNRTHVVQYLTRVVRDQAIAEELAQDVFLRVYRSRHKYLPTAKFSTWLYRITTNIALNHFRDRRKHFSDVSLDERGTGRPTRDIRDRTPLVETRLVRNEAAEQIRQAVQALPEKQRLAVIMHKYQGLDYAQIAATLGCTIPAVKALMFRAYETLRVRLRFTR